MDAVDEVRARFRPAVAANRVGLARQWGRRCHGFNVHITPGAAARRELAGVQDALSSLDQGLLRCPEPTLHVSVAWLLGVQVDYPVPKATIWSERGAEWTAGLAAIARQQRAFELRYRWLAVTDTAVIALAAPVEPVRRIREAIARSLRLPAQTQNVATLVHTTLFRFGRELTDPAGLLSFVDSFQFDVPTTVTHLDIHEELEFPSLVSTRHAQLPFRAVPEVRVE